MLKSSWGRREVCGLFQRCRRSSQLLLECKCSAFPGVQVFNLSGSWSASVQFLRLLECKCSASPAPGVQVFSFFWTASVQLLLECKCPASSGMQVSSFFWSTTFHRAPPRAGILAIGPSGARCERASSHAGVLATGPSGASWFHTASSHAGVLVAGLSGCRETSILTPRKTSLKTVSPRCTEQ